jgi:DNA polymerase III alpha subunit (gram-positive type)
MKLSKKKYIIIEIIPTSLRPETGEIVQLSALKLDGIKLLDRFDYRLKEELNPIPDLNEIINYDKDSFIYKESTKEILDDFISWSEKLPVLILDNEYTNNYLASIPNKKESILKYLNEEYQDDIINKLIQKYGLEPSNYIVDLLFESLIREI